LQDFSASSVLLRAANLRLQFLDPRVGELERLILN
jgi:hypothetical protein